MLMLAGFCGCAVDAARVYVVNSRLQQACDAGALAGRRAMVDTSTTNTVLDPTATSQAQTFFANNFRSGWFGTMYIPATRIHDLASYVVRDRRDYSQIYNPSPTATRSTCNLYTG